MQNENSPRKVVVITGASSGIGEATAIIFAQEGFDLVIAARNEAQLAKVRADCMTYGATVLAVKTDVSKEADCKQLISAALMQFERIDVLINNAGISMRALFADADLSVIKNVMDINFWGTVYCTKFALPSLLLQKGSVIGVSSIAGFKGLPGRTGYSASKFAMEGFLEALKVENIPTGLHVGVICPGYTASNIRNAALNKEGMAQSETPLDESKLMQPEEVAYHIYQMVLKRKSKVVLTLDGKLSYFLNKFFPELVNRLVFKKVSKEKDSPFK